MDVQHLLFKAPLSISMFIHAMKLRQIALDHKILYGADSFDLLWNGTTNGRRNLQGQLFPG
jgi:hypothetical protein